MLFELRQEAVELARARAGTDGASVAMPALDPKQFDERNVRRRVYDALNVLMAVGVIRKDKATRKILWQGLPNKVQDALDVMEVSCVIVAWRVGGGAGDVEAGGAPT